MASISLGECPDPDTGELVKMLVDGRNRLEACKRVKVEPATVMLNAEDPTAFVLSANIHRRHMTKGQQAMAVAMVYTDGQKRGPKDANSPAKQAKLSRRRSCSTAKTLPPLC